MLFIITLLVISITGILSLRRFFSRRLDNLRSNLPIIRRHSEESRSKLTQLENKNKTLEGTAAFFFGSLPAWIFIGSVILPLAIITALVESVDTGIDDNLLIPIVCVIVLSVI